LENGRADGGDAELDALDSLLQETTQLANSAEFAALDPESGALAVQSTTSAVAAGGAASVQPQTHEPAEHLVGHIEKWTPPEIGDSLSDVEDNDVADVRFLLVHVLSFRCSVLGPPPFPLFTLCNVGHIAQPTTIQLNLVTHTGRFYLQRQLILKPAEVRVKTNMWTEVREMLRTM
jgi:hypothetical protein